MSVEITKTPGNPPIRLAGHINWAHERGSYPGCKMVVFDAKRAEDMESAINDYFATKEHAALVVDIKPLSERRVAVVFTKRLTDDEKAEMDEFNSHYAEWKEERKHARLEAEEKARKAAQERIDAERKERELTRKQVERFMKVAVTHIKNCKKSPEDAAEAKKIMEGFLADTMPVPATEDPLPEKTELS